MSSGGSRLAAAFARGPAFIPYVTAGDPDLETTAALVRALADAGADVIELGVPFSDPIADGPTNQRAAERALRAGTTLSGILQMVSGLRESGFQTPLVLFTYLNPLLSLGPGGPARLGAAGIDGVLAVDLPVEETIGNEEALRAAGVDRIAMAAPTTSEARLRAMADRGSGFVYYVCRYGVTGARAELPVGLGDAVRRVRALTGRPVAVGFGISTPAQAAEVAAVADGVVVGSALVRLVEEGGRDAVEAVRSRAAALATAVHATASPDGSLRGPASPTTPPPPPAQPSSCEQPAPREQPSPPTQPTNEKDQKRC